MQSHAQKAAKQILINGGRLVCRLLRQIAPVSLLFVIGLLGGCSSLSQPGSGDGDGIGGTGAPSRTVPQGTIPGWDGKTPYPNDPLDDESDRQGNGNGGGQGNSNGGGQGNGNGGGQGNGNGGGQGNGNGGGGKGTKK